MNELGGKDFLLDNSRLAADVDDYDATRAVLMLHSHGSLVDKCLVVMPVRPADGMNVDLAMCFATWFRMGFEVRPLKDFMGGFIEMTRQAICNTFLKEFPDKRYLIMIDNDISPPLELPFLLARHGVPYVGSPCIIKSKAGESMNFTIRDPNGKWRMPTVAGHSSGIPATGLVECGHMGTGAVCIRRDVLESFTMQGDDIYFLITQEMRREGARKSRVIKGEDIHFSYQVRRKGYKIYADMEAHCGHWKNICLRWPESTLDPAMDPSSWRSKAGEDVFGIGEKECQHSPA